MKLIKKENLLQANQALHTRTSEHELLRTRSWAAQLGQE